MVNTNPLLVALGSSVIHAATTKLRGNSGIQWGKCDIETQGLPVECARLPVPLDYSNGSSAETLDLALIRYPAQNGPSQGTILLNFGGPGQDGLNNMISYAPIQGPWDPRGTGQTLRFACFEPEAAGLVLANELPDESPEVRQRVWDQAGYIAGNCTERLGETGDLVGMAFTARDMFRIVDALGEDGKLRYWGISGGTTLGATAAALFPDRIDKVILDGVMNSHQYYHSIGETEALISSDDTLVGFIRACFDNPKKCPLTAVANSSDDALKAIVGAFEELKTEPLLIPAENADPVPITYSIANSLTLSTLYRPNSYQFLASILTAVIQKDTDALVAAFSGLGSPSAIPQQAQAIMGIRCGDKIPREDKLSDIEVVEQQFHETSKYFPGFGAGYYLYACAQWSFKAKERYEGDFRVKTSSPLLFIGNTYDPITPLASARNMSAGFEGSVVLHHDGFGHTSIAQRSNCTNEAIAKYFADGTLPKKGTVCAPNQPLFANDEEIVATK
ncbi:TAP-like protein-domain-containing protein [Dichotomopilus funicola]|uniref:TAP-like protein-domain-containing protein n=1 Tax=Dichotomopilus funicola TaxID=1934379 RepID=A0AAN6V5A6_9PEZI|nr:TAP-like protein-domain-containing protein [Dichotomopilus funicola]